MYFESVESLNRWILAEWLSQLELVDCSGRNKGQKLVGHFLKIGHFVSYQLPSH